MTAIPDRPDLPSPKATWLWWEALIVVLAGVLLGSLPVALVYRVSGAEPGRGASAPADFAASGLVELTVLVLLFLWLRQRHPGWARVVRIRGTRADVGYGLASGAAITIGAYAFVGLVLVPVLEGLTDEPVGAASQIDEAAIRGAGWIPFVLAVAVIAPVVEEFFFRGVLYRSIRDRHGIVAGTIASVPLFALSHFGSGSAVDVAVLQVAIGLVGLGLTLVYERRKTLVANVVAHATFNLVTVLAVAGLFGRG